jgi:hypothetical protein
VRSPSAVAKLNAVARSKRYPGLAAFGAPPKRSIPSPLGTSRDGAMINPYGSAAWMGTTGTVTSSDGTWQRKT